MAENHISLYTSSMKLPRWKANLLLASLALLAPALFLTARAAAFKNPPTPSMGTLTEILSVIEDRYAPETDSKKLVYSSIQGMLDTLDPHTNFLDEEAFREMREEQKGVFYGLGIVISKRGRFQPLRVVAPMADTPADRMGIRGGDVITHIRDTRANADIDTIGLTVQEAVKYLRGPKGSEVEVSIERPGIDKPLVFKIIRDAVRTLAVNQSFLIRPEIGYIHIANFTETTTAEFDRSIEDLRQKGAKKLILDLSGNPGGLLEQSVQIASRFLDPGQLVVYTEGRHPGSRQDFNAVREAPRIDWPVVVIIDRESASASEIVSGALQDHDRAILVGETTFGKGLVQSVYSLSEGTALALTTQKYYTPVGRSIQRPYISEEEYFLETRERDAVPKPKDGAPIFQTDTGRLVYGGGGITPDIAVSYPDPPEVVVQLARVTAFSRFAVLVKTADQARYTAQPEVLLNDFVAFATKDTPTVTADQINSAKDEVLLQLRAELALITSGVPARDRVFLEQSPVLLKALDSFSEAQKLQAKRRGMDHPQAKASS